MSDKGIICPKCSGLFGGPIYDKVLDRLVWTCMRCRFEKVTMPDDTKDREARALLGEGRADSTKGTEGG